jgi:hypothetical protein
MMTDNENDAIRGEALARMFSKWAQPTELDRARALDMTIRAMAQDRYTNPQALIPPAQMQRENVKPVGAGEVVTAGEKRNRSGWAEERPLPIHSAKGSREEALIDAMTQKFAGGPNSEKKE